MSKKHVILTSIFCFAVNLVILLTCVLTSFNISNNEARDTLTYYADSIALIYKGEESNDEITLKYGEIYNIRITIFKKDDASPLLEINPLDEEVAIEDRLSELTNYGDNFYTKVSLTTNYETLYYVKITDNYFIRVGLPTSSINEVTKNIIIYGLLTVILVEFAFTAIEYYIYKRNLNSLKANINELEKTYGDKTDLENEDGIEIINKALKKVKVNYANYINEISKEKIKNELILNSLNEGFVLLNSLKNIILINKFAINELGLIKDYVINRSFLYLGLGEQVNELIEKGIEDEVRLDFNFKDKTFYLILEKFIINKDENYFNYGIAFIDVTEVRKSEKIRRNFVQNASHELKTPLTTILGYESLINSNLIDGEDLKKANTVIESEALRMKKLIEDMLVLSEIESSSIKDDIQEINLKEKVESVIYSLELSIKEKHLDLRTDLDDVYWKIDPQDFDILVRNLITNAIKYNKEKGFVNVSLKPDYISIEDNGIGISEKDQGRIFERFFRVDKARSSENGSTGLGLAIVKHLVLKYDFRLTLDSTLGEGSKFTIYFKK